MPEKNEILLCNRGRYREQVAKLADLIRKVGLQVSYDREILAVSEAFDPHVEVSWFSLTGSGSEEIEWRAPLWKAVENSELIVFLVNPHDVSENVVTEGG